MLASSGFCPMARSITSAFHSTGIISAPYIQTTQNPIRTDRRRLRASSSPAACAAKGMTAFAKPKPTTSTRKNIVVARTEAANVSAPNHPNMTVSTNPIPICAICVPINGKPSAKVARKCAGQLLFCADAGGFVSVDVMCHLLAPERLMSNGE